MKRILILATLLICLVSVSKQQEASKFDDKMIDCLKVETYTHLTGMVLDLYYNKLSFKNFIESYIEYSNRGGAQGLIKCIPADSLPKPQVAGKVGLSILYASDCEKDIGPLLYTLETVINHLEEIKHEWKVALSTVISLGISSYKTYGDCKTALLNIRDIFNH